jgi:hypothetical protein
MDSDGVFKCECLTLGQKEKEELEDINGDGG